jgi:hypothetical protein
MRFVPDDIDEVPHPEEPPQAASRRAHRADPAAHNFFLEKSPAVPPSLDGLAVFAKIGGVNVTDDPIIGESRS